MLDGDDTTLDQNTPDSPASGEVENSSLPPENDPSDLGQDTEGDSAQNDAEDDEFEDLEYNGKAYRVPKELKPGWMKDADYTRKTQEVAKTRAELEADKEAVAQQAAAVKEISEDRKKLFLAEASLERYSKIDWAKLEAEDPFKAQTLWREQTQWERYRDGVKSQVQENEAKLSEAAQTEKSKRVRETFQAAAKIPGFIDNAKNIEAHAIQTYGITSKQLDKAIEEFGLPFVKMVHKAYLGDQLITKQQQAAKTPSIPQEPVKPLAVVSKGKAPARSGLHDDLDTEEWAKRRLEQLRNRK